MNALRDLARKKFKTSRFQTGRDVKKETKVSISEDTINSLLYRDERYTVTAGILACAALGAATAEIAAAARADGDDWYWRLMSTDSLSVDEQRVLDLFRALSTEKQKTLLMMMEQLRG